MSLKITNVIHFEVQEYYKLIKNNLINSCKSSFKEITVFIVRKWLTKKINNIYATYNMKCNNVIKF